MENKNLVKVYGCYTCKLPAGELRKQKSTYREDLKQECCYICNAELDFFYLNIETMCFQKRLEVADEEVEIMSHAQAVAYIMQESNVTEEEATRIYIQIKMDMVTEDCESLQEKGFAEVYKVDADGTPCYRLTPKGEEYYKNRLK